MTPKVISTPMNINVNRHPKVTSTIVKPVSTAVHLQSMWLLYSRHYKINQRSFLEKLEASDYYALYQKGDQLIGFTSFRYKKFETPFGKCQTLYIDQTVVDQNFNVQPLVTNSCFSFIIKHYMRHPFRPLYIWSDINSIDAYLNFTAGEKKVYPSLQQKMPKKISYLLDQIGVHYFGINYFQGKYIVKKPQQSLHQQNSTISNSDPSNPYVVFFENKNPNHLQGNSLLTIKPISIKNIFSLMKKYF